MKEKDVDTQVVRKKVVKARRNILKSVAAGGTMVAAMPAKWSTPIVDSVVVPAHAATTGPGEPPVVGRCPPAGSGSSDPASFTANITAAVVAGNGTLVVVGEADVPGSCRPVDGGARPLECDLIDCEGVTLGQNQNPTFADITSPSVCDQQGGTCIISCSVEVAAGSHSVVSGESVTLRFTLPFGGCIASAVTTVT